jgi:hypothetical protein
MISLDLRPLRVRNRVQQAQALVLHERDLEPVQALIAGHQHDGAERQGRDKDSQQDR